MTAATPAAPSSSKHDADTAWVGASMPFARFGLIVNLLVPIALLIWDACHHMLGADPVNFALHTTGFIALLYLLLSLLVTPLRDVTGFNWLVQFRRSLGVYAFYYACAHLTIYFWFQEQRDLGATVHEIIHRYYLLIGFTSLALMAPLWATSFNAAIRKLGGKNWKRLHRLAYLAAILGCIHYYLQSKADKRTPDIFFTALGILLLYRVIAFFVHRARHPKNAAGFEVVSAADAAPAQSKERFWKGPMRVIDMIRETPTVRTFRLAPAEGQSLPFAFSAGQFVNVAVEIDGKRVTRSYTIASPPIQDRYIDLTIKRETKGQVSSFLHDQLMAGHTVEVSGPNGRFTFDPASGNSILLIAGGVGITPVMSILRHLTDQRWPGKIDLIFSVRSPDEIIFADELKKRVIDHPSLDVCITVTRDTMAGDPTAHWTGPRGRITLDLLSKHVPDFANRPTFICGPDQMAQAIRDQLITAGVPTNRITLESFTPAAAVAREVSPAPALAQNAVPATTSSAEPTVTFVKSNKTAPLHPGTSILEAAESVGVTIDYDCRSGFCGQCRSKLLKGTVTMEMRDALSDADEADGYILACQAQSAADCQVDA